MGLIKSALTSINSTLHDQWEEYITCDSLDNNTLVIKKTTKNGVISNKSRIQVSPGQVALIFDSGKVLDATAEERANRRLKQNMEKGIESNYEEILENIKFRDHNDKTSDVAPLRQAEDAIYVDSTHLSIEEVVEKISGIIQEKRR